MDSNNNSQDFACLVAPPGIVTNDEFIPDDSWYYMDAHNQVQGPFKNVMMIQWYTAGYFKSDLVLWRACDKQRLTFAELMVLSEGLPFVRKDPLPPITEPLLTSNSIVRAKLELSELEQFIKLKEMQKQKQNAADLEWPQDQLADLEVTAAGLPVNGFRVNVDI